MAQEGVPAGFRPAVFGGSFMAHNGPLYARLHGERLQLGFRVEARHTNPLDMCHGGMLALFADMLMPCAVMYQVASERRFLPTISLQLDYLASAPRGAWVHGEAEVLRSTRNMVFTQGLIYADGALAVRVSGVFKQGPLIGDGKERDPFALRSS
jgi:uncharacterized protein (TIGR00369 family)